jgi:hypothetical protein
LLIATNDTVLCREVIDCHEFTTIEDLIAPADIDRAKERIGLGIDVHVLVHIGYLKGCQKKLAAGFRVILSGRGRLRVVLTGETITRNPVTGHPISSY